MRIHISKKRDIRRPQHVYIARRVDGIFRRATGQLLLALSGSRGWRTARIASAPYGLICGSNRKRAGPLAWLPVMQFLVFAKTYFRCNSMTVGGVGIVGPRISEMPPSYVIKTFPQYY